MFSCFLVKFIENISIIKQKRFKTTLNRYKSTSDLLASLQTSIEYLTNYAISTFKLVAYFLIYYFYYYYYYYYLFFYNYEYYYKPKKTNTWKIERKSNGAENENLFSVFCHCSVIRTLSLVINIIIIITVITFIVISI